MEFNNYSKRWLGDYMLDYIIYTIVILSDRLKFSLRSLYDSYGMTSSQC